MARSCPACGAEYVSGERCSDCGTELQDSPAGRGRRRKGVDFTADDAIFIEPRAARTHSDPFIVIWEGPTSEGTAIVLALQNAAIPVDTGEAAEAGRMRIEVPRSYMAESYAALDSIPPDTLDPYLQVPDDLSSLDETDEPEPEDRVPWARVGFAVVAILLVLLLLAL